MRITTTHLVSPFPTVANSLVKGQNDMLVIGAEWQLGIFNSTSPFTKFQTLTPVSTAPSTRLPRSSIHIMDSSPPCKYHQCMSAANRPQCALAACSTLSLIRMRNDSLHEAAPSCRWTRHVQNHIPPCTSAIKNSCERERASLNLPAH